ncbi:hypothetical protein [Clostridium cibarium]|nr:hypothetical protein [Clostridium cibarium]
MKANVNRKSLLLAIKRNELDDFLVGRGVYPFGVKEKCSYIRR